jgi:membrane protein YdbS with pleckstrin-like domain
MTLITCSECGKPVSTLAAACPNCGAPPRPAVTPAQPPGAPVATTAPAGLMAADRPLWTSSPSAAENTGLYLGCVIALLGAIAGPLVFHLDGRMRTAEWACSGLLVLGSLLTWGIGALRLKRYQYAISSRRLTITQGIFGTRVDDIALYRIRDVELRQSFWQRLGGIGSLIIISSDAVEPAIHLLGVKDPEAVRKLLRSLIDQCRQIEGVRTLAT